MKIEELNQAVISVLTMMVEDENNGFTTDYESIWSLLDVDFNIKGHCQVQFVIDTLFEMNYISSLSEDKYQLTTQGRKHYFMEIER